MTDTIRLTEEEIDRIMDASSSEHEFARRIETASLRKVLARYDNGGILTVEELREAAKEGE
jgi:hypothetical protein